MRKNSHITISSNANSFRRSRKHLRQGVKIFGGQSKAFQEAVSSIQYAFICFGGHFNEGKLEVWDTPLWQEQDCIEASARYMTYKDQCHPNDVIPFGDYVDPLHHLTNLMGSEFVHGPDNEVDYMEAVMEDGVTK